MQSLANRLAFWRRCPEKQGSLWMDFAKKFWHRECVCGTSEKAFINQYQKWYIKTGYRFSEEKASSIYVHTASHANTLPMTDLIKCLVTLAVSQLNTIIETISIIQHEMLTLAAQFPEYPIVALALFSSLSSWQRLGMCAALTASSL